MKKDGHHHGNLHEALITSGIEMLQRRQPLTLRGAAMRVGVSHSAPAHHFDGLDGLRTAIAARAMQMLDAHLDAAGRDPDQTPFQRLLEMSRDYCDFAVTNAHLFHLMFSAPDIDHSDPALSAATTRALGQMNRVCAPFVGGGDGNRVLEHAIWSIMHGNAVLRLQVPCGDPPAPASPSALAAQFRLVLRPENEPA